MTTANISADASIAPFARPAAIETPRKRTIGLMGLIAAFAEALEAKRTYDRLVESGTPPSDAARKALLDA